MIVYSKKIIQFVDEIKTTIQIILSHEIGLKVSLNVSMTGVKDSISDKSRDFQS